MTEKIIREYRSVEEYNELTTGTMKIEKGTLDTNSIWHIEDGMDRYEEIFGNRIIIETHTEDEKTDLEIIINVLEGVDY